jgi:EcoRII C terminal
MDVSKQDEILSWVGKSFILLIKKLSRNDCLWAEGREYGHQNGVYIPKEVRESGFFPQLVNTNPAKPHIFESSVTSFWPETGETKTSALKHYSNKGPEMHFTGVPKELFSGLTPASLLLGGRLNDPVAGSDYWFMTIDSASEEAELVESMFDLASDFHFGLFDPAAALSVPRDETEALIRDLTANLSAGTLQAFINSVSTLPSSESLAAAAQESYMKENGLQTLDPFAIPNPGDAIMRISRDIEFALYKRAELRHRAAEVVRIVTTGGYGLVESIVRGFPQLDATFLSASQHRKSRAGRSFERHIARFLNDGRIQFEEQAVTGGRRPDFVMPNLIVLNQKDRAFETALVLSAKTTLRERWKQLAMERFNCALFLATVDDRVSADAIDDMLRQQICLVVPESLKDSKETCYSAKENVITFRTFFDTGIAEMRPHLRLVSA